MDTRAQVLAAALSAFVELGYDATTTQEIRTRAGVSNGSLFHFFPTKEAIGAALYLDGIKAYQQGMLVILEQNRKQAEYGVKALISYHLDWIAENESLARFIFERGQPDWGPGFAEVIRQTNQQLVASLTDWLDLQMAKGHLRRLPKMVVHAVIAGTLQMACRPWLSGQSQDSPKRYVLALANTIWSAIEPQH